MALDVEIKRRINNCRDILVGKVPDPKAQIEQITIALIYKFMNDIDKEQGRGFYFIGELKDYTWENLMDNSLDGEEFFKKYVKAIELFQNAKHFPEFFQSIFRNTYVPYKDARTLKMFLKEIDYFSYDDSEKLGDAFEYLLSIMGSQGDAGQFRTPRHIIDFIVNIVKPKVGDTVLDPACGTAGFLISAFKFMKENQEEWSRIHMSQVREGLHGFDISPDMVRMAKVNMFLHGFENSNIKEFDTLSNDKDMNKWNARYDIILANPPFMTPKGGIKPHELFDIESNRAEVLFVDYISSHLKDSGRAGIIVPEGIIFQSGKAYKALRKELVDRGLYAVVSLPSGVFNPYSGVKTSILLLDKELRKKTKEILFLKVENDGLHLGAQRTPIKGNELPIIEKILEEYKDKLDKTDFGKFGHLVSVDKIAEDGEYNLSGDRYREDVVYSGDWPLVELESCLEKVEYTNKIKSKDVLDKGKYIVVDQSEKDIAGYWNKEDDLFRIKKPIVVFGDHTRNIKYIDFDFVLGADGVKILEVKDNICPKYFYYILKSLDIKNLGYSRHYKELKNKKIPLPPLEIQEKIVEEIEGYQKIVDGAKLVVENYKPSFRVDPEWERVELGSVCDLKYGYSDSAKNFGRYRFVRITDINNNGLLKSRDKKYIDMNEENKNYILSNGDLLVARTGATFGKTLYFNSEEKSIFAGYLIRLNFDKKKVNNKYYWCFTRSLNYWNQANSLVQGGGQPQFNANLIKQIRIPLPSLKIQKEIVAKIEEEQKLVDSNKKLIEIFEGKIKDKIGEVWGEDGE